MQQQLPDTSFLDQLKCIVGPKGWIDPTRADKYFIDPRGRFRGEAALVLLPSSTDEVSRLVTLCNAQKVGIIPFGGGTGGTAGHIDFEGRELVVLSLERMNAIRSVNTDNDAITVEAGCVLADVQEVARQNNRRFGLSLASQGSCTIGGNLASNAGGIQVLRYGNTRDMCLGIEAVWPDGSVLNDLRALRKDNTGYDLRNLLIGSEGTLGIITAATLKLSTEPVEAVTFMCALRSPKASLTLLRDIRGALGDTVTAIELMCALGVQLATRHFPNLRDPFDQPHPWYVVVEVEGCHGISAQLEGVLGQALESGVVIDAVLASSDAQRQSLWNLREFAYEYNTKEGAICSSDTSVPIGEVGRFIDLTDVALAALDPALRANRYGHVGDGNIHVNVFPPEGVPKQVYLHQNPDIGDAARKAINITTEKCGGSISAEHGIGRLKRADLQEFADPGKLSAMRAIKAAIDPNIIMNPGALLLQ